MLKELERFYTDYCGEIRKEADALRGEQMPPVTEELFAIYEKDHQDRLPILPEDTQKRTGAAGAHRCQTGHVRRNLENLSLQSVNDS